MNPEKEKRYKDHINKQVRSFKKKMTKLAIDNKHPWVTSILEKALRHMEKQINEGLCDCRPGEYELNRWDDKD